MTLFITNINYSQILAPLISLLLMILFLSLILTAILSSIWFSVKHSSFKKSTYKKASGNSFFKTIFNKGNYGEFLTYKTLEKLRINKKLLTNLYIPLKNGNTTEIDMVMICNLGIFVIESKNYSGWIFGNEYGNTWTQTFPNGQKNKFYNPIMQNNTHINALKRLLELDINDFYSYIIFSERCELKKVRLTESNAVILKRSALNKKMNANFKILEQKFTDIQIENLFTKLSQYSNVSNEIKLNHIRNLKFH